MSKSKMKKISVSDIPGKEVIAGYIRVSTDKQREEGYSIDVQRERLSMYSKSLFPNAEYREYVDDGYTGASLDRPKMQQLIEDAKEKKITHVIVMKLDRLSRSQKDTLYLIEDVFLPHNISFISMGESFNTATPFGRAVLGILSVFAQLERENIYERTRSGMTKRVESGLWPGGGNIPFGYDYDRNRGILVPNKDADTVRRIYQLYLSGYSLSNIARLCGLKYERLAMQILTRKSNTGIIQYNGAEYKGQHEAIISEETYQKAMIMFHERSLKRTYQSSGHLLTGHLVCGECGAKMRYVYWGKNGGFKLVCYSHFSSSKPYLIKDPNCANIKPSATEVESIVMDALFHRAKEKIEEKVIEIEEDRILDSLREQRDELNRKLRRLYDLYATATDDMLLSSISDVKSSLNLIEAKIIAEEENQAITYHAAQVQQRLDTIEDCWPHLTMDEKKSIINDVIDEIIIKKNNIHINFKY